jgi:4-amino-4-deoxy-L-arabinose transferase-like glycosyltransferase
MLIDRSEPNLKDKWVWLTGALVLFVLFFRIGTWGVIDTSEARYAEIARKMYETGDYLHPIYLGIEHYHKPPVTYWLTTFSYHIFGVNPFSARFFLQLALLLQIVLVYQIGFLLSSRQKAAIYAAAIYASFFIVWVSVRNLTTDAYLTTFLLLSTWSVISYLVRGQSTYLYLFALFTGLAFLTKITAVFVFLGPLFLFLFWQFRPKWRFSWHFAGATLLLLLLSASWFILLELEGKPVLKYLLYDQSVVRYSSDTFNRNLPFYFYLWTAPLLSFPWLLFVAGILFRSANQSLFPRSDQVLFGLCFVLPIVFFSLSHSKLLLYILPSFWVLAVLAGKVLDVIREEAIVRWNKVQAIFILLLFSAMILMPLIDNNYQPTPEFYQVLIICLGVLLLIYIFNRSPKIKLLQLTLGATFSIVVLATWFLPEHEENSNTGKIAAQWLRDEYLDKRPVYIFDQLAPSFAFHLDKDIILIGKMSKEKCSLNNRINGNNFIMISKTGNDCRTF